MNSERILVLGINRISSQKVKVHKSLEVGRITFLRKKMKGEAALCTINFKNTEIVL